jgi:hypothetical protein
MEYLADDLRRFVHVVSSQPYDATGVPWPVGVIVCHAHLVDRCGEEFYSLTG